MKKKNLYIFSFISIILLILFILSIIYFKKFDYNIIYQFLNQNKNISAILYILIMALAIIISPIPSAPLAIFSGYFFGTILGFIYTIIGATIGAIIAFLIGRYFSKFIIEKFGKKLNLFNDISENKLMITIFITRLIPLLQFDLISYGAGITKIRLSKFTIATLFGMMPVTFLLVYSADMIKINYIYFLNFFIIIVLIYILSKYLKHRQLKLLLLKKNHKK